MAASASARRTRTCSTAFNEELKAFIGSPEHIALVTPFGFGKGYLPDQDDGAALRRRAEPLRDRRAAPPFPRARRRRGCARRRPVHAASGTACAGDRPRRLRRSSPSRSACPRDARRRSASSCPASSRGRLHDRRIAARRLRSSPSSFGVAAALARLYGPAPLRWLATRLRRDLPRHLGARPALLALLRPAAISASRSSPSPSPSSPSASMSAPTAPRSCAARSRRVPRGQWEATVALNMTRAQALRRIILPQAVRRDDPALGQSLHRAPEDDGARLAHHHLRSRLQGAGDEPDDDEDDRRSSPSCC